MAQALRTRFPGTTVLIPPYPGKAVTTGAVLFALAPRTVEER